jgi:MYXO-CTERM domain-containing protein
MQCKCSRPSYQLVARCATFVALVAPLPVHAQQFVLVDQTYTATADNTEDSHFTAELAKDIPADLRAPTNFANGSIHVDLEILEAPGDTKTLYNICLENSSGPACLPYVMYEGTGKYKADPKFSSLWQYDMVDWTKGVSKVSLILKDEGEKKVQGNDSYYPYKAHVTLTIVAPGATFDPDEGTTSPDPNSGSGGNGGAGSGSGGRGASSTGQGGSKSSAGEGGRDAASSSSGNSSSSNGSAGSNSQSSSAAAGSTASSSGALASGSAGARASTSTTPARGSVGAAGSSSSSSAVSSGSDAGTDDEPKRSIAAQLENTSGCSVAAVGAARTSMAWPLLAVGLSLLRRRKR